MSNEYPPDFLRECEVMLGSEYGAFLRALSEPPTPVLRINPKRHGVAERLNDVIVEAVAWEKNGFYASGGFKPGSDPLHFAGGYYMQEASAMAPARVLDCKPGQIVLDLCAAPGGKSGQIAADLRGEGALIANEPNEKRAAMLAGNLERLGVTNACVVCERPAKLAAKWPGYFDAVMVDAPCSGEGMFRRDPASRAEWSPKRVLGCAERQREILDCAVKLLKPSGRLVYSTCTFNTNEDEENARWFAAEYGLESVDFSLPGAGRSTDGCLKLLPHRVKGEGQFMALFKKGGEALSATRGPARSSKDALNAQALLEKALGREIKGLFDFDSVSLWGDSLCALKSEFPDMSGIKTFMFGVRLAKIKNGYAVPEHALAMALGAQSVRSADVTLEEALCFMRGLEIAGETSGWTLVTYAGMPLGFGKCSEGRIRNHLPKGLRL